MRESDGEHFWELPGGRIDVGEEDRPLHGRAARELSKSWARLLGRDRRARGGLGASARTRRRPTPVFLLGYSCRRPSGEIAISSEHVEFRWVTQAESAGLAAPGILGAAVIQVLRGTSTRRLVRNRHRLAAARTSRSGEHRSRRSPRRVDRPGRAARLSRSSTSISPGLTAVHTASAAPISRGERQTSALRLRHPAELDVLLLIAISPLGGAAVAEEENGCRGARVGRRTQPPRARDLDREGRAQLFGQLAAAARRAADDLFADVDASAGSPKLLAVGLALIKSGRLRHERFQGDLDVCTSLIAPILLPGPFLRQSANRPGGGPPRSIIAGIASCACFSSRRACSSLITLARSSALLVLPLLRLGGPAQLRCPCLEPLALRRVFLDHGQLLVELDLFHLPGRVHPPLGAGRLNAIDPIRARAHAIPNAVASVTLSPKVKRPMT